MCAELEAIENDMVKKLIKMYREGINYKAFWEIVDKIRSFSEMRKAFCGS